MPNFMRRKHQNLKDLPISSLENKIQMIQICRKVWSKKKNKSDQIIKKFHDIYTQITGKQYTNESNRDLYWEDRYYEKIIVNEVLNAYFSFFSIIFSVAYYEFTYRNNQNSKSDLNAAFVSYLYIVLLFSIFLWINIILYEIVQLKYDKVRGLVSKDETLISSGRYKSIIVSISLTLIHPDPAFENIFYSYFNVQSGTTVTRSINSIFSIFVFTRSYFILRLMLYVSSYMKPESNRICKAHYFDANLEFSLKALLKSHPLPLYFITSIIAICYFAFSIQVFERDVQADFNNFLICIYYILVTMATLGYGDYFAKTNEGRIIAMIACIFGVFLMSMIIISVNNLLEMSRGEQNALFIINKVYVNQDVADSAKNVINQFSKIVSSKISLKNALSNETELFTPFKSALKEFNEASIVCQNFNGDNSGYDKIYNSLNGAMNDHLILKEKQKQTREELLKIKAEVDEIYKMIKDAETNDNDPVQEESKNNEENEHSNGIAREREDEDDNLLNNDD